MNPAGQVPAHRDPEPDADGFVLAGGQSSRMGRDKALLAFAGQPLVAHALDLFQEAGLPAMVAGAASPALRSLPVFASVIDDDSPGLGPLSGICAALSIISARFAVFLPVDLAPASGFAPRLPFAPRPHHRKRRHRFLDFGFYADVPRGSRPRRAAGTAKRAQLRPQRLFFRVPGGRRGPRPTHQQHCRRTTRPVRRGFRSAGAAPGPLVPQPEYARRS